VDSNVSITDMIKVGMGDLKVAKAPNYIITLGLGSCVGITMYDPINKIGAMLHAMLPDSTRILNNSNKAKFVDTGIVLMLDELVKMGANKNNLEVKLFGGAKMFTSINASASSVLNIGENNVLEARTLLKKMGMTIKSQETGDNFGRTIVFELATGHVEVRAIGQKPRIL